MSSDTEQGEERRLPATWEAYQHARRAAALVAFANGAQWAGADIARRDLADAAVGDARERFPITRRVPRVADLSEKVTARVVDGRIAFQAFDGGHHYAAPIRFLTPEDVKAVADLMANPFKEVVE